MVRAIIFDCFGVLITDALEGLVAPLRATHPEKAVEISAIIAEANKGQLRTEESRPAVANLLGITVDEYLRRIKDGEVKNQQLLDYIKTLRAHHKTALLSNVGSSGLAARFTSDELSQYFDTVVISGIIGYAKPEAQAYEITADRLDARLESCVMIDDREEYCQGARAVGMQAIQYVSFEQMRRDLEAAL